MPSVAVCVCVIVSGNFDTSVYTHILENIYMHCDSTFRQDAEYLNAVLVCRSTITVHVAILIKNALL